MLKKTEGTIKNGLSRGTRQHWTQDTERRQTKQKKHPRKLVPNKSDESIFAKSFRYHKQDF
jgi:hypothetical protein